MKEKQLEALIISRDSWHRKFMSHLNSEEHRSESCELCEVFIFCKNCPVRLNSGKSGCLNTPYIKYLFHLSLTPKNHNLLTELAYEEFKFLDDLVMEYLR